MYIAESLNRTVVCMDDETIDNQKGRNAYLAVIMVAGQALPRAATGH